MDNFANIGKAVLIQSLGLQKNYIEIAESSTEVIDYCNASCANCKWKALLDTFDQNSEIYHTATSNCQNCPSRTVTQKIVYKKIYHNEKNKYGYKPRLKSNAIKLLLLLHFNHPDRFGIIKNIDLRVLSHQLKCDVKTIKNNLEILKQYAYISFSKTDTYFVNLCLTDYESYYLPANQGGRGFFVLSKELLYQLLRIDNLLALRIHLRELLDIDNLNAKGPFTAVSKTYSELRLSLPDYCKPGVIRNSIHHVDGIFDISFNESSIRFEINEQYNARKQKNNYYNHYILQFQEFMKEFNHLVSYINVNNSKPVKYTNFFDLQLPKIHDHYKLINIRDFEIEDLAQLAVQYSFDIVLEAYSSIYKTYVMSDRRIINLGGLIRTAITSHFKSQFLAA